MDNVDVGKMIPNEAGSGGGTKERKSEPEKEKRKERKKERIAGRLRGE